MNFKEINPKDLDVKSIYHLLISGVSPRPIAFVGSLDKNGNSNLAPFSFFNAFGANPPIIGFSPALSGRTGLPKDTLLNIKDIPQFTVSIVNSNIIEQVSLSSCEFNRDVDEFKKTGLTKLKSKNIQPFGVAESNFIMECKLYDIIELGKNPASGNLILGEVIFIHINKSIINKNGQIDPYKLDPIARNGGSWYTDSKKGLFELNKPKNIGIGFDYLPKFILNSTLTGNELSKLASVNKVPEFKDKYKKKYNVEDILDLVKKELSYDNINEAWNLCLYLGNKLNEK